MSSWEAEREAWELKHMQRMEDAIEDAEKGDPEAMVIMAIGIYHTQYNCEDQAIQILKEASDKGSGRASWLLADIYAGKGALINFVKIEKYCRRAMADGNVYSDENEDDALCHAIFEWVDRFHRGWQEMEEGFWPDGKYYLYPTGRYMKNAFRGIGKKAALKKRREEKNNKNSDS